MKFFYRSLFLWLLVAYSPEGLASGAGGRELNVTLEVPPSHEAAWKEEAHKYMELSYKMEGRVTKTVTWQKIGQIDFAAVKADSLRLESPGEYQLKWKDKTFQFKYDAKNINIRLTYDGDAFDGFVPIDALVWEGLTADLIAQFVRFVVDDQSDGELDKVKTSIEGSNSDGEKGTALTNLENGYDKRVSKLVLRRTLGETNKDLLTGLDAMAGTIYIKAVKKDGALALELVDHDSNPPQVFVKRRDFFQ